MRKIAVIGAGAIGGIVAAHLTRIGENVEVICKHDDLAQIIINYKIMSALTKKFYSVYFELENALVVKLDLADVE